MHHQAYQLNIRSDLALPELATGPAAGPSDVDISWGSVAPDGLPDGQQLSPFLWAAPQRLWLHVPQVARFLIEGGSSIRIDPAPGADQASLRVFLLGSAFGALLIQRGLLVLHGNAVQIGDQCVVCVGPSGAGKSTLAAGFMQRGHAILADDVVAVDAQGRALPGCPRIKLWHDAAYRLDIDTAPLPRVRPELEKFTLPVQPAARSAQPLPVRWIYILDSDNGDQVRVEALHGVHRFKPLHENTYRMRYLQGMALGAAHLQLCGRLAARVRLARVTRSRAGFKLDALIAALQADIAAHP